MPILALELIRPARDIVTPQGRLVRAVRAILLPVAHPILVDASDIVVAIEFFLAAMTWPPAVRIILKI